MSGQSRKRRAYQIRRVLFALVFLFGFVVLMYPTFSNVWNQYRNAKLQTEYAADVSRMDGDAYAGVMREAREYNDQHKVNHIVDAFDEEKEEYILSHPYDDLLNPSGNEIMGQLRIPKIHVNLAIYHGLGSESLEQGCGHVEGTSLPIGGKGTHAALAAHRGLPSAKLFTDADQLEEGDLFYIVVLNETLAYVIDQIKTVEPGETSDLAIDPEGDFVTLITCTPYGINTHRLLIRGTRTEVTEEPRTESLAEEVVRSNPYIRLMLIGLSVFVLYRIISGVFSRKKKEE